MPKSLRAEVGPAERTKEEGIIKPDEDLNAFNGGDKLEIVRMDTKNVLLP
jgi:hypothetical protein